MPRTIPNVEYARQLTRSAGSIGANYIEGNESLSRKDFVLRAKICRKEAKESRYWLQFTKPLDTMIQQERNLFQEATELIKIFNAIVEKSKPKI